MFFILLISGEAERVRRVRNIIDWNFPGKVTHVSSVTYKPRRNRLGINQFTVIFPLKNSTMTKTIHSVHMPRCRVEYLDYD
jgi:hypothetical protein